MKLSLIVESTTLTQIEMWSEDSDDFDPWIAADQADNCAKLSEIRISRNKNLTFLVFNDRQEVVGATWSAIIQDSDLGDPDSNESFYDFDVAVHPKYRHASVGVKLIEASIEQARSEDVSGILVYVVNPKLIKFLEKHYGFNIESHYSHGSAHMSLRF